MTTPAAATPRIERHASRDGLPLSFAQQRIWFIEQLQPGLGLYNEHGALRLLGAVDLDLLARSFQQVVARHEILRTVFPIVRDRPVQTVRPALDVPIPLVDLRSAPEDARDEELRRLASEHAHTPFDTVNGPLVRLSAVRLDEDEHVLLVTIHHLVADGWSLWVLTREFAAVYEALQAGRASALPDLPMQYGDYAAWQRSSVQESTLAAHIAYWKQQLQDAPPALDLPIDAPRGAVSTFQGATRSVRLSASLSARLKDLSRRLGVTTFATVLTGLHILLQRWTGHADHVVSVPVAGRTDVDLEALVGCFINVLLVRCDLSGNPPAAHVIRRVHETATAAYARQDLPFDRLVRELMPDRRGGRTPFSDVLLNFESFPPRTLTLPGLSIRKAEYADPPARAPITLYVEDDGSGLLIRAVYQTELFAGARIGVLLDQYQHLLGSIADHPEWTIDAYSLVTPQTADLLPDPGAPLPAPVSPSVIDMVREHACAAPHGAAVEWRGRTWSYRELVDDADTIAGALGARLSAGDVVAVAGVRSYGTVAAMLGTLASGCVLLPLDVHLPIARQREMLELARARAIVAVGLVDEELFGPMAGQVPTRLAVSPSGNGLDGAMQRDAGPPPATLAAGDPAYVFFTSGTTGTPKGILGCHGGLGHFLRWQRDTFRIGAADRCAHLTALSFDVVLRDVFLALVSGGTLCVPAGGHDLTVDQVVAWLTESDVTVVHVTPSVAQQWLRRAALTPAARRVRYAFFAGEPLSDSVVTGWRETFGNGCEIVNLYGPTETTLAKCWHRVPADGRALPPIQPVGSPLPDTQALILSRDGRLCGIAERGEIAIRTPCRTLGYLTAGEEERRRFAVNPHGRDAHDIVYWTGDAGVYRLDGTLQCLGRLDDQIKIRGVRVEPDGVAAVLARHPRVQSCTVLAERDESGDARLLAYVVAAATGVTTEELRRDLARHLPAAMVPSRFVLLDHLPLSPNGKVDRRALPRVGPGEDGPRAQSTPPRTPVEDRLATIWMRLLALEQAGVEDDFFALGGHSLLATELAFQIRRTFGCELPLRQLFETPTIAGLASALEAMQAEGNRASSPLPTLVPDPARRHEPFPLTDIQQAYWVGRSSNFALGNVATHNYTEFQFPDLDLDRLATAFNRLIARHDMLRAMVTSDARQRILERVAPYTIAAIDLRDAEPAAEAEALQAVRARLAQQVLPLDAWPLFEVVVSRLRSGDAILHVSIDALICDAWSRRLLGRELLQMYREPERELPALEVSFRDYVLAEAALHDDERYRRAEAYWMGRLASLPPAPELPLACSPESLAHPQFVRQRGRLEAGRWSRLKARAASRGLTPSGLLGAAYAEILGTWSSSPCFTLNLTLFNRVPLHPQIHHVVGDFTSLTLLAVDRTAGDSFQARARAVQARLWDDLDHRQFGGVRVIRELHRRHGGPRGALMPVVLTSALFDDSAGESDLLRTWHRETRYGISQTPQVFLDHGVSEQAGALVYSWDAVPELFPPGLLTEMFTAYQMLLDALAADDETAWTRRTAAPPLPEAQQRVRARVNATAAPRAAEALHAGVVRQIAARPDAPAVVTPARTLTYGELGHEASAVAAALGARRAGAELVAVVMEKGWEQVVAVLGILEAGAAYLPIDAGWPQARQTDMLQRGQVRVAVTQPAADDRLAWPGGISRIVVRAGTAGTNPLTGACVTPAARAYVIFTSGSTGRPKGVVVDHAAAVNTVHDVTARWRIGPADRVLGVSALSFDLSVYDIFGVLGAGGTLVMPGPDASRDPDAWLSLARREGVTLWNSVPALFEMLVEAAARRASAWPGSLRLALLSGDWIPVTLPGRARALAPGLEIVSLGGATEAAIWSIAFPIGEVRPEWASIPYGQPLTNQTWQILTAAGAAPPDWVPGALHIGGVGLAQGYWRDPARTAERFVPDAGGDGTRLYRTGDLGRYWPDGTIEFLGRTDLQVKVQGHRIELGEIEATLAQHPAVRQAAAVALGARDGPKRLLAYVTADGAVRSEDLRGFLQERLPAYMVPPVIVRVSELPLTSNGKVDHRALAALEPETLAARPAHDAAPTPIEELVADACAAVLRRDTVSTAESFFQLGGDSISAIRFASRVREACGIEVPLRTIFGASSLRELVQGVERQIRGAHAGDERRPSRAGSTQEPTLSSAQRRMWFLCRLDPDKPFYNLPAAVRLSGPLRIDILERALAEIVRRHDALRTAVRESRGRPFLSIAASADLPVPLVELTEEEAGDVIGLVRAEARGAFDLAVAPLCRARIFRTRPDEHVLVLTIHHLVADAWSLQVLYRELAILYAAFAGGQSSPLPDVPLRAVDLAAEEDAWLRSDAAHAQRRYWMRQLAGPLPVLALPYDTPPDRSTRRAFGGARQMFDVPSALAKRIADVARDEKVTPFMLLLGAYAVLLAGRTGQTDLIISTSLSNGRRPDTEGLVALLLNTVLLRMDLSGDPSFRDVLARVKAVALGALANGDLPFEEVVKAVLPSRSLSVVPISSVAFGLRHDTRPADIAAGLALTPLDVPHETAKFDLELQLIRRDGDWTGFLDYRSDAFTAASAAALVEDFQRIVALACAEPALRLGTLVQQPSAIGGA